MSISDLLVPEYDREIAVTREVLSRVPDDRATWKPHPKSFPMAHLAQLVARLPGWVPRMFDRNAEAGRNALLAATDEVYRQPWTLKKAGKAIITDSRYLMLRTMVLNHHVHHRAQLALYLRLTDQKVPEMYGPTGDE